MSRMRMFFDLTDDRLCNVITNGPHIPTTIVPVVLATATTPGSPELSVPKLVNQWLKEDIKLVLLDKQAKIIIGMSLPDEVFESIRLCSIAYEMWNTLKNIYIGTPDIIHCREVSLTKQYELFRVEDNEKLPSTYT